jgi:hypothetical protein
LNIAAVIGQSFSMEDMIAVQMRFSDATAEATIRKATVITVENVVKEGIFESTTDEGEGEGGESNLSTTYSFHHAVWRTAILNLMLEGRKRDLHRSIAESLEAQNVAVHNYMYQTKMFSHWKASSDFPKSAELALSVGKHFEERLGLPAQSLRLYNEALDMFRERSDAGAGGK